MHRGSNHAAISRRNQSNLRASAVPFALDARRGSQSTELDAYGCGLCNWDCGVLLDDRVSNELLATPEIQTEIASYFGLMC